MDELPVEILDKICGFFSVEELQNIISSVSTKWRRIAEIVVDIRVKNVNMIVPLKSRQELVTFFAPPEPTPKALLMKYETTYFVDRFKLVKFNLTDTNPFLKNLLYLLSRMDVSRVDGDLLIEMRFVNESLKFIPSHGLAMIVVSGCLVFVHQNFMLTVDGDLETSKYHVETSDPFRPYIDSSTVTMVDVYQEDIIITSEDLRYPCFYNISQVNHSTRTITLNLIRQIFFPLTLSAVRVFQQRVVALFSTGDVGIWRRAHINAGELVCSKRKITKFRVVPQIFRIHNLLFIKSSKDTYDLMDASSDEVELTLIPIFDLLFYVFPIDGVYKDIITMKITGNIFLVEAAIVDDNKRMKVLCAMKLKYIPAREDFMTKEKFMEMIHLTDSRLYIVSASSIVLIPPPIVPGHSETSIKGTVLTIETSKKHRPSHSYKVQVLDFVEQYAHLGRDYTPVEILYDYNSKSE